MNDDDRLREKLAEAREGEHADYLRYVLLNHSDRVLVGGAPYADLPALHAIAYYFHWLDTGVKPLVVVG
jgi:hypothetical protein